MVEKLYDTNYTTLTWGYQIDATTESMPQIQSCVRDIPDSESNIDDKDNSSIEEVPTMPGLQEQAREDSSSEDDNNNDSYNPIDPRPSIDVLIILIILIPIDTPPSNNYDNKVDLVLHTDLTHLHQSTPDYNRDNEH